MGYTVEGNVEVFVTSIALLVIPFVATGALWLVGRLVLGGDDDDRRTVPPSTNQPSRVIPGTRSEEAD